MYEGEWSEDYRSGWGRMYYENGDIYEGEWLNDKNHGQGIIQFGKNNLFYIYMIMVKVGDSDFKELTFKFVSKQMETGMKVPGEMARRMAVESSTILTKVSFMKAFGWKEQQNVGPCLILGEMKHQHQLSIQFHRYKIVTCILVVYCIMSRLSSAISRLHETFSSTS